MPIRSLPLLCLALACGPRNPDADTGDSTGQTTTTTATITTGEQVTTSGASSTSTGPGPTQTSAEDPTTGTTAADGCVVDPPNNICSAGCDMADCCGCSGRTLVLDPRAPSCVLPLGVVTDACPWQPHTLHADDLEPPLLGECGEGGAVDGWTLELHDGDQWVELCGQTCEDFLAGEIQSLTSETVCELA